MPPFKVYKVMQDINQQLYERKDTPEEFIPVYGVVITVPIGIYIEGQKEFTCDKTFDEAKEILLKGGSIIAIDNNNDRINFGRIDISNNSISATITYFSHNGDGINKIDLSWDKGLTRVGGEETKSINTFVAINGNQIIKSYNIDNIIILLTNNGSKEEVLAAINSIFTNFAGFVAAIGKPNSVFHNGKYGTFNVRYADNIIIIQWSNSNAIHHVALSGDGSYVYNTIQIVDQTLYRLSKLTIDPIVNPKIWVGTATQYAAIAQKDNNTTYIVKSDV
ncbi:MAG: hypothetical protein [Bacteriophage sp.]|nr:MAG: hypothetical protein [Bacteriophage sp.]